MVSNRQDPVDLNSPCPTCGCLAGHEGDRGRVCHRCGEQIPETVQTTLRGTLGD
jgi:hypothetical protein